MTFIINNLYLYLMCHSLNSLFPTPPPSALPPFPSYKSMVSIFPSYLFLRFFPFFPSFTSLSLVPLPFERVLAKKVNIKHDNCIFLLNIYCQNYSNVLDML